MGDNMIGKYPISESFYTWQGEGVHMGRAAYFVRLYGCPQHCRWCDSAATWHPDYRPASLPLLSAAEISAAANANSPEEAFVVLTGGEPILYDLWPLTRALHGLGRKVHMETSGIAPLRAAVDWLTLSPKPFGQLPLPEVVARADEVKIIVYQPTDIQAGLATLTDLPISSPIWLHPEWSRAREQDPVILNAISEAVKKNPRLRAGYQLHKLYRADELDINSNRRPVPLGGNSDLGY